MTKSHLERKLGESLIRILISELEERINILERQRAAGHMGESLLRYRMRWIRKDYNKLEQIAKRYGFKVS